MRHTPLSTNRQGDVIFNANGIPVVCDEMYMPQHDMADRMVACWNSCAGTTTDDLNRIAESGGWNKVSEQWSEELRCAVDNADSFADRIDELEKQQEELLDTLELVVREFGDDKHLRHKPVVWEIVKQTIANALEVRT
jgi:hypothetical protein